METNNFALYKGKIVFVPEVPERIKLQRGDTYEEYNQALQSAIASGIEVENQEDVMKEIFGQDELEDGLPFNSWRERVEWAIYPLQCRVEIVQICETNGDACPIYDSILHKKVARVTFEQPEEDNESKSANWRHNLRGKPEAAGQEQETVEEFLKKMKPQVATFDKHDKVAKLFDYYDLTGFAVQYASQQTASLQKQVEELREQYEEVSGISHRQVAMLKEKDERIAQLEEALKEAKPYVESPYECIFSNDDHNEYVKDLVEKALNPQDNQKGLDQQDNNH